MQLRERKRRGTESRNVVVGIKEERKRGKKNYMNQHFQNYPEFWILVARISDVIKPPQGQEWADNVRNGWSIRVSASS